jgi:haloalkane dehalogenase
MTKVLLTTPCQPYPVQFNNVSLTDSMNQRFTQQQDIFTSKSHTHCQGMHMIAQNISVPSIYLEYPTWHYFEKELRKGYDFIGIGFFQTCTDIVIEMCKMIRKLSPQSKIVLGHYGALAFNAYYPEDFKREHADYICIGEGVQFFRQLLGEPPDGPITQRFLPRCGDSLSWLDRHPKGHTGFVTAGLGCPSGCDFCATTEMHANQRVQLGTPDKVFQEMKNIYRAYPETMLVWVYDEDWLKYTDEVREVGRLIQEDTEFGLRKLNWFTLCSIESLNQYEMDELPLTGFKLGFIGIESKFAPQEGYQKREGALGAKETIHALHDRGISTTGGLMLGFDFHDRVNIQEDINYYVACEMTTHQISQVVPFPGTPLWYRLKEENRVADVPWIEAGFYGGGGYKYRNFENHELQALILEGYRRFYETWGPSVMRQLKVELNGYEWCRASSNPLLRDQRAGLHKESAEMLYPLIRASEHFAPNGIVRRRIRQTQERYIKNLGKPTPSQEIMSYYVLAKAFQGKAREYVDPQNRHPKQEPFKIYIYDKNGRGKDEPPYRVVYPERDKGFEFYNSYRSTRDEAFTKVLGFIDNILAPGRATKSVSIKTQLV